MKSETDVLRQFAVDIKDRLVNRTIRGLRKITDTLSGDDSGLINAWDEICVQIQGQLSGYWDAYDETARSILADHVAELKDHEKLSLWFQTEDGWDWLFDDEEDRDKDPPVCDEDIVVYIVGWLYAKADEWSNKQIRAYMDRG